MHIPNKLYFNISEVSNLCSLKPHVLRYWEQEFPMLSPVKRSGNRRYYKREDILLICKIKDLLYEQGFTIEGAKTQLTKAYKKVVAIDEGNTVQFKELIVEVIDDLESLLSEIK